jgi:hypothetical protein
MLRKRPWMVPQGHSAINRARAELTMVLANKSGRQNLARGSGPKAAKDF